MLTTHAAIPKAACRVPSALARLDNNPSMLRWWDRAQGLVDIAHGVHRKSRPVAYRETSEAQSPEVPSFVVPKRSGAFGPTLASLRNSKTDRPTSFAMRSTSCLPRDSSSFRPLLRLRSQIHCKMASMTRQGGHLALLTSVDWIQADANVRRFGFNSNRVDLRRRL